MTAKRAAFLSDVHGNSPALEAVLRDIASFEVDELVSLGDIINGLDPQGCVQLLRDWTEERDVKLTCIMGNAEAYLVTPNRHESPSYGREWWPGLLKLIDWYQDRLTTENFEWIQTWPMERRWRDAVLVHDSPLDRVRVVAEANPDTKPEYRELYFHGRGINADFSEAEWDELDKFLQKQDYDRVFCGHTHGAFIVEREGKTICNVGSAGAPLDGDWRPAWVLLEEDDAGKAQLTIHRVEYDLPRIVQLVDENPDYSDFDNHPGKMDAFKAWYATGIHWKAHLHDMLSEEE